MSSFLQQIALFLGCSLLVVPLLKRLGLAAVLGYLATGMLLGPNLLGLIQHTGHIMHVAEYGVVMLLFIIGLELQPARLWVLRKSVFGLGSLQMVATGLVLTGVGLLAGFDQAVSVVAGFGLAMSSTAFVLQLLAEKKQLTARHGREAFAILLFQDMAVIPLLAVVPVLAGQHAPHPRGWLHLLEIFLVFGGLILSSRFLVRPVFRLVATSGIVELFTGLALFIVLGIAMLMQYMGVSMALGSFLAGVLLADSEYRHELEANIQPFKGLLLGLFFITVGMSADLHLLVQSPMLILGMALGLMLVKFAVLVLVGRLNGSSWQSAVQLGATLAQGGEFAFVLFTAAFGEGLMPEEMMATLTLVVTVSMALTPLAMLVAERWLAPAMGNDEERAFDTIEDHAHPVIIAGFGRFGQIVARVLRMHKIGFTALEASARQVDFVRRFGNSVYYGNPANIDLLHAAGMARAKIFVLAMDDVTDSVRTAEAVRRHFPQVQIYARARDRNHAYQLIDIGVRVVNRETYLSSLDLAEKVLLGLGYSETRAARSIRTFRDYDDRLLLRQQAIYQDEAKLAETAREAMEELENLFESDERAAEREGEGEPAEVA
jgi:glutathione-regulated potassium-efflux system protein KefB